MGRFSMLDFLQTNLLLVMQFVTLFVSIYIAFTKSVKRILIADFIVNISLLVCYLILGDTTTSMMYICISIRSFVYIHKERFSGNWIPWVAIAVQLVLGFATMDNPFQLISVLIPCWVCWYLWYWQDDKQKIRLGNIINNGCWGIYNGIVGLWIVVLMRIFVVCANTVSIYKHRDKENVSPAGNTGLVEEKLMSEMDANEPAASS